MFALAEAALADAQIACWDSKYFYNRWRPITAIRLGDQDGNPATVVDPGWQPLINTPSPGTTQRNSLNKRYCGLPAGDDRVPGWGV